LAQNKSWFQKALGYFYFKVGKGEGFGVKDLKIGPAKADIGVRWNGKDFKQTTDGIDLLPAFRTSPSMIWDEEKGKGYVEEQAHGIR
jgi:hypothetical protein